MGEGDFIRVGGQIHNNNFENEKGKRYGMAMDVTSSTILRKKAQKEEVKEAPKADVKEAANKAEKKPANTKRKATSRKKGVQVG